MIRSGILLEMPACATLPRSSRSPSAPTRNTTIRYGGEELLVISMGGTTDAIVERLETFRRQIEQSVVTLDDKQATLTLSLGVWSGIPTVKDEAGQLFQLADAALYEAKSGGRNR